MRNKLIRLASSTIVAGVMAGIVLNAMPQAAMAGPARGRLHIMDGREPARRGAQAEEAKAAGSSTATKGVGNHRQFAIVANWDQRQLTAPYVEGSDGPLSTENWAGSEPVAGDAGEPRHGNQEFMWRLSEIDLEFNV